jgi:hypothetical protein
MQREQLVLVVALHLADHDAQDRALVLDNPLQTPELPGMRVAARAAAQLLAVLGNGPLDHGQLGWRRSPASTALGWRR